MLKFEAPPSADNPDVAELFLKGIRHIGFLVDDIDAKVAELKSAGFRFFSDVVTVDAFKSKTVYFWGPEGIAIQLSQAI